MDSQPAHESTDRLAELAERLDCMTDQDLQILADVKVDTLEAWRKRGEGPPYVRLGRRFLYPRQLVSEWLQGRVRERRSTGAGL